MTIKLRHGFVLLALLAAPAIAGKHDHKPKPAKSDEVCRTERETGSILPTRTCMTAAQWAEVDAERGQQAHTLLEKTSTPGNSPELGGGQ